MVFVNGQKFACATCIKGHRSTTCNHGERPLHEIKKKGRPSIQCTHCKELRKAKQVNARCICGREEGSAAVANGLKRAKSLSCDARLSIPAAIGGEDLLRSFSTQDRSTVNCSDAPSSNGGIVNCGCHDGIVCANCLDHAGHAKAKPTKDPSRSKSTPLKGFSPNRQRSATSLDLGKSGMLLFPQDSTSPLPFLPHGHGGQAVHSPDGLPSQGMNGTGIYPNGSSPLLVQALSPSGNSGNPGCDHSPSSSSMGQHSQVHPNLCFDYASSSDYDSDHYNPTTSYSYFPETLTNYPVSNASDDMEDMDLLNPAESKKIMDGIMNGTTTLNPMESPSADEIRMLYSALSSFSTASPSSVPTPPIRSYSSPGPSPNGSVLSNQGSSFALTAKKGCCGSGKAIDASSPASSILSHSPSAGRSEIGEDEMIARDGCGCAISPNMCCCGERCACPGCLAYPNNSNGNQNMMGVNLDTDMKTDGPRQATSNDMSLMSNGDANSSLSAQALNLSAALSLIQDNGQAGLDALNFDTRQALKQELNGRNLSGLEAAQMQHPTLLSDNGVLICGCGCGRPTVDCAECFRDMCLLVGEDQAKMMKDEIDFESAIRRDAKENQPELNVNMNMAMNTNMNMDMTMNISDLSSHGFATPQTPMPQTMSLLSMQSQRSDANPTGSLREQQQQQRQSQGNQGDQDEDLLMKQRQQQMQLAQQMQQRQSVRLHFRKTMEDEQKLQLQLMEQEQMKLQQMHQSMSNLNNLQLDFLDNEDWSFVNEIRTDGADVNMNGVQKS
ncbi:hypothetical protein BGX20_000962 [Mortierella sp. AD010]|nr:hypothetical protein BGX20_000962 [Mortierella sp. AD010]